jgi:TPR repeat protein
LTEVPCFDAGFEIEVAACENALAQSVLGCWYSEGKWMPLDYGEAVRWYSKAAELGDADAQKNLGVAYRDGRGVPQDLVLAHMWLDLAASSSAGSKQEECSSEREAVASRMTPQQVDEARALAQLWKVKSPR